MNSQMVPPIPENEQVTPPFLTEREAQIRITISPLELMMLCSGETDATDQ